jgi:hypothetical protein
MNNKIKQNIRLLRILIKSPKKTTLEKIQSSKVKVNNYLDNEKVESLNNIANQAFKRKLISVNIQGISFKLYIFERSYL